MLERLEDIQSEEILNPLHQAIKEGDLDAVEKALEDGADLNGPCSASGDTPLIRAIRYKHKDIAALLIAKGAKVSGVYDSDGFSVLAISCSSRDSEMVQMVLTAGVDVNEMMTAEELTALHVASRESTLEIVQLLIDNGADVESFDWDGQYASDIASDQNIIQLLKSRQKPKPQIHGVSWWEYFLDPCIDIMSFLGLYNAMR